MNKMQKVKQFFIFNEQNAKGQTILHLAGKHPSFFKYFLKLKNIDYEAKDYKGRTPLFYYCKKDGCYFYDDMDNELSNKLNHNARDNEGKTPLHVSGISVASCLMDLEDIELLPKDNNGKTPLDYAIENGDEDLTDLYKSKGIEVKKNHQQIFSAF